jgi:hypothetical protein
MSGKNRTVAGLMALIIVIMSAPLPAQDRPVQVSLFTPVQIFPEDVGITGVRLNLLYGRNISVIGLDLGLVNHTTAGKSKGVQWGLVSLTDSDFLGWQNNSVNVTRGNFEGFQWGLVNYANFANGFQLGFVNYANSMKGLQIGLVNIIKQGGQFPVFPIVNWSF